MRIQVEQNKYLIEINEYFTSFFDRKIVCFYRTSHCFGEQNNVYNEIIHNRTQTNVSVVIYQLSNTVSHSKATAQKLMNNMT